MSFFRFLNGEKTCVLCHAYFTADNGRADGRDSVCSGCLNDMRHLFLQAAQSCPQCAKFSVDGSVCGECQTAQPPVVRLWASLRYAPPLPIALHEWKHLRQSYYCDFFCQLMLANPPHWLPESGIDAVLAMPLSRKRRIYRGFNQSDELAAAVTRYYKLPLLPHFSVQRVHKAPQSTLLGAERAKNVRRSFTVDLDVKNRKVLIIDDVMTTGASIFELARTLHHSGAAAVYAWVVARNL